jgi:uncharacterized membrane protein YagU involved in acid resistance
MLVLYRDPPKTAKLVIVRAIKGIMGVLQHRVNLVPLDLIVAIKFYHHAQQILGHLIFLIQLKIVRAMRASTEAMHCAPNASQERIQ